jgi:hypothetical protein
VEALCRVLHARLHQNETLRTGLAVSTLSAIATVRSILMHGVLVCFTGCLFGDMRTLP